MSFSANSAAVAGRASVPGGFSYQPGSAYDVIPSRTFSTVNMPPIVM